MLKYLIETTEALLMPALLIGLMFSFACTVYEKKGRIPMLAGVIAGILGSGVLAYLKNTTKLIVATNWNYRIVQISLAALALFFLFALIARKEKKVMPVLAGCMLAVISCGVLLYILPDVFSNPYSILLTEKSVLSSAFILKTVGILLGMGLVYLAGLAVSKALARLTPAQAALILTLALLVNGLRQAANCIRIMLTKRIIMPDHSLYHPFFQLVKFTANHDMWFTYAVMLIAALVPVLLLIRSTNQKEPYRNPAEHRKIRRKWQISRRWAGAAACCLLFALLNLTWVKDITTQAVDLAPVEETDMDNENMYVRFEQVADGHLHRFAYVTEDGVEIRFIVIQKPNSSSYGIGLDACDICGETGYYEKDGQVVCKLCDVVMNINTIGFKGGCNPIVIPYSIADGQIIVPIEGLLEYKKEFQ